MKTTTHRHQLEKIAATTMRWPFRLWGFGEAIAIDGLLEAAASLARPDYQSFVAALCLATVARGVGNSADDHLAPGRALLRLHQETGDEKFLNAASAVVSLHHRLPTTDYGALLVRSHQPGWQRQIWVDSMDMIGPLHALFARVSGDESEFEKAVSLTLAHARHLQTNEGLFYHGYDVYAGQNGHLWARGQGWALRGMLNTLIDVPVETPGRSELMERWRLLLAALVRTQRDTGMWATVVDHEETYEETTLAAMVAYTIAKATRKQILEDREELRSMAARARTAVRMHVDESGTLGLVSGATAVGQLQTYATRPFGVFPWGQGALLLMECAEL